MNKIDWSGELEAYHEDGRVVPVLLVKTDLDGDRWVTDPTGNYKKSNMLCCRRDGETDEPEWRIRNVQPTPLTDRLTRLEAFVARVAGGHPSSGFVWNDEAKALVAELNPVDPDVLVARKLAALVTQVAREEAGLINMWSRDYLKGEADQGHVISAIVEALRQARKEGNDNGK